MKTKFDIGEEVLVKAKVVEIKISSKGMIRYFLKIDNRSNVEDFDETEIIAIEPKEQK